MAALSSTRVVLATSLACNLFLAGWVVGGLIRPAPPPPPFGVTERLKARLTPAGYARIAADLAAIESDVAAGGARFEPARRAVVVAAAAVPFDPAAFSAALAGLAGTRSAEDVRMSERLVELVGRLDAADRSGLAETLFSSYPGPPPPPPHG